MKGRRKDKEGPTPPQPEEQKEYLEDPNIKERISDADLFKLVALPPMLDLNEWLATNTISFFNHVNLIYGVVSEHCTADTCPSMTAPDNVQYFWFDDKGKKTKHTAPQYIDYVMTHIQKVVNDECVFPTKFDHPFPSDLDSIMKRIHKYLFHVLAHMYHAHYRVLRQLGLHAHLNTLFTHFMVFTSKFDLVQDKEANILLHLFSLLLKNLADPNQNPKLREGLGIRLGGGKDDQDSGMKTSVEDMDLNLSSSVETSSFPKSIVPACQVTGSPTQTTTTATEMLSATTVTTTVSSSFSSVSSTAHFSDSGGNLSPCDTGLTRDAGAEDRPSSPMEHNGLQNSAPPSSSASLISFSSSPTSQLLRREGEMVVDSDPTKSPSEWLANLQVSAT